MMKQVIKGFTVFAIIVVNIMWAAWIFAAIWRGVDFNRTFNAIMMATLCLLCWLMVQRIEALTGQKRDVIELAKREYKRYRLLHEVIHDVRKLIADGDWREDSPADTLAAVKEKLDTCKE